MQHGINEYRRVLTANKYGTQSLDGVYMPRICSLPNSILQISRYNINTPSLLLKCKITLINISR